MVPLDGNYVVPVNVLFKMKISRKFARSYFKNFLLNNVVDDDVQSILLPLNLMQYIMVCPKYRIKNDLIFPNSSIFYFVSLLVTLLYISLLWYRNSTMVFFEDFMGAMNFTYFISFFDCVFYSVGFTINYAVNLIQTKKFIKFVLTFQKVHRFLHNEYFTKSFIIWNWIIVILSISGYITVFSYFCININAPFYAMLVTYFFIFFDFNIIYAIRILKLLEHKVVLWNIQATENLETEDINQENYMKKMFQTYVDILESYNLQQVCTQQFVSSSSFICEKCPLFKRKYLINN